MARSPPRPVYGGVIPRIDAANVLFLLRRNGLRSSSRAADDLGDRHEALQHSRAEDQRNSPAVGQDGGITGSTATDGHLMDLGAA